ncbi:hypothetical protein MTR67_001862 [Solanum verrucosum]|uniref:Uncharacterized protein n=1 Tax=Solanum verrucosum TaxID=315347 RepID=A0AAF0PPY7_SOLVR|nr:hypothetical protein MTR67_001862 [Solanum verrucosum]
MGGKRPKHPYLKLSDRFYGLDLRGEFALTGLELVHEAMEKVWLIREWLKTTQSRQKSYADVRRKGLEIDVDDWVYFKTSPMKGVMSWVFHVSLLKKCVGDMISIVPLESLGINESLSYEEVSVENLNWQVKKFRNKVVASVKVL